MPSRSVLTLVLLAACASVSTSDPVAYPLAGSELRITARAERGATSDHLFIAIDGSDVADGPFGPAQAAGTLLRGAFRERPVEARCRHRWRPGIHIGYRCLVSVDGGNAVELDF